MNDVFQSASLIGERVVIITRRTVVLLHIDDNGLVQAETCMRPDYVYTNSTDPLAPPDPSVDTAAPYWTNAHVSVQGGHYVDFPRVPEPEDN